ncbi:unnamed protein product [Caenorhabditis angaria]|uniref:Uncharacterized protein n=1 Tax=Caenorhabditis angaria TaxID=860376 RepID=A0A9P1N515_9PELO|nr:unnamed protein product [Caenorhabditis angaria]
MNWRTTTAILCIYGAVKEFRPATPFLTPFLVSSEKNLTLEDVYSQIYPYWTYSYMIALIPMFILTDILRYKPIILIEAFGLTVTWLLLVFGQGVWQMQLMQISFGISSAAEIAYYSYIYSMVDQKHYKKATSYVRTSALFGKLLAFLLGQILISSHSTNYLMLNIISLIACCLVTVIAIFLPKVKSRKSVVNIETVQEEPLQSYDSVIIDETPKSSSYTKEYFRKTVEELKVCSKNRELLKWSIWWALASCGMYQVQNYIQSLWREMQNDPENVANGFVELTNTLLGTALSFSIQYFSINWSQHGQSVLTITSLLVAGLLYLCSKTTVVLIAYGSYIVISSIYHMLITAASANVAKEIGNGNNHGLIFGCNTFVAVFLQTILTLVVVDSHFLHFDIRTQFMIYSGYFGIVSIIFATFWILSKCSRNA